MPTATPRNYNATTPAGDAPGGGRYFIAAGGDAADRLPTEAREKLLALRQARSDAHAIVIASSDKMHDLLEAVRDAERDLQRLQDAERVGRLNKESIDPQTGNRIIEIDTDRLEKAQARLDRAREASRRDQAQRDQRGAEFQRVAALVTDIEAWLNSMSGQIVPAEPVAPKLKRGETIPAAVERLRTELAAKEAELAKIESAPQTAGAAKAVVRREVEALAKAGAPSVQGVINHADRIKWPSQMVRFDAHVAGSDGGSSGLARGPVTDARAMFAWLFGDRIIQELEAQIDAADAGDGMTDDEKQERFAELEAVMSAIEREEEALIELAAEQGQIIARRPEADPAAVLGVVVES